MSREQIDELDTRIAGAIERAGCTSFCTIDMFMGETLKMDLDDLATMPGTPGAVLTAQFAHYMRSSVNLTEEARNGCRKGVKMFNQALQSAARRSDEC